MTNKINFQSLTPNLMVEDVNATIDYYTNILGFKKIMTVPESGKFDWAMLGRDQVVIMLQSRNSIAKEYPKFKNTAVGGALTFYIAIEGLDDFYQQIKDTAKIVQTPHTTFYGKKEFAVEDGNGYLLTFCEDLK
jgi:lactoylglutathione lyase